MTVSFTPIDDGLMRRPDLKFGAKCLFGRLKRYAHKSGKCYPSFRVPLRLWFI